jgi:hypothetical protein
MSVNDVTPCASHTVRKSHKGLTLQKPCVILHGWTVVLFLLSIFHYCSLVFEDTSEYLELMRSGSRSGHWRISYVTCSRLECVVHRSLEDSKTCGHETWVSGVSWMNSVKFVQPAEKSQCTYIYTFLCCSVQSMAKVIPA